MGYKPLVPPVSPEGKATASLPKFDEKRKLYTFFDVYNGANITVDQQAVPEKFKGNETEIKKIAESVGANETFTSTQGTVYASQGESATTQRLVLANDKMLMFIQSTKKLSVSDWIDYIQTLE